LLVDFLLSEARLGSAFDTNHLDPLLAAAFPKVVQIADLATTRGQMMLFDHLIEDDRTSKVVDLWHVSYDHFFQQAAELDFFNETLARGLKCVILLLTDLKERFVSEFASLSRRCRGADVVLVHNEGLIGGNVAAIQQRVAQLSGRYLLMLKLDQPTLQLLEQPEILVCRFMDMMVPDELQTLQKSLSNALLPVFEQFELIEVAADVGLPSRSLLPRRKARLR
jgi:hypothetical protein